MWCRWSTWRKSARGAACAEALVVADRIGCELEVPVFLYGELTWDGATGSGSPGGGARARTRAELRRGGVEGLMERMAGGAGPADGRSAALRPDFGPPRMHRTAGATLVAARPPLVAFNVQLAAGATLAGARAIAARIREGGEDGLPGVRAIAVVLGGGVMQVSMNVERPLELSLAEVVAAVGAHAPVESAELVGLVPAVAMEGFPQDVPLIGYDPARQVLEKALGLLIWLRQSARPSTGATRRVWWSRGAARDASRRRRRRASDGSRRRRSTWTSATNRRRGRVRSTRR